MILLDFYWIAYTRAIFLVAVNNSDVPTIWIQLFQQVLVRLTMS